MATILKMATDKIGNGEHWSFADFFGGHSLAIFFGQNILPILLNIYAKSCGNPFGDFRYKWGQRFKIGKFQYSLTSMKIDI
jgi:hypothetical protein